MKTKASPCQVHDGLSCNGAAWQHPNGTMCGCCGVKSPAIIIRVGFEHFLRRAQYVAAGFWSSLVIVLPCSEGRAFLHSGRRALMGLVRSSASSLSAPQPTHSQAVTA